MSEDEIAFREVAKEEEFFTLFVYTQLYVPFGLPYENALKSNGKALIRCGAFDGTKLVGSTVIKDESDEGGMCRIASIAVDPEY